MNKENRLIIRKKILEYAPYIQERLPDHPSHPRGRIAVAHCYHVLKTLFGCPVDQADDSRLEDALDIIEFCKDNAEEMHIVSKLRDKYKPEPKRLTIEDFF